FARRISGIQESLPLAFSGVTRTRWEACMAAPSVVMARRVVPLLCLSLCLSAPLLAQRSDRAVIGGGVPHAPRAAVVGATVTVTNDATGVEANLVTNSAGAYTTASLVLGTYTVTVNLTGFKKAVASGIVLHPGDVVRHDVTLTIGALTESVEVSGE